MADRVDPSPLEGSSVLATRVDPTTPRFEANMRFLADLVSQVGVCRLLLESSVVR